MSDINTFTASADHHYLVRDVFNRKIIFRRKRNTSDETLENKNIDLLNNKKKLP